MNTFLTDTSHTVSSLCSGAVGFHSASSRASSAAAIAYWANFAILRSSYKRQTCPVNHSALKIAFFFIFLLPQFANRKENLHLDLTNPLLASRLRREGPPVPPQQHDMVALGPAGGGQRYSRSRNAHRGDESRCDESLKYQSYGFSKTTVLD